MIMNRNAIMLAALTTASCGTPSGDGRHAEQGSSSSNAGEEHHLTTDHIVVPPKEYYEALTTKKLQLLDAKASTTQVVWVNFNGGVVNKGFGTGESFILCKSQATIENPAYSEIDQVDIMNRTAQFFTEAGTHIVLTRKQPAAGEYTTVHIAQRYNDLGCVGLGVLGIAPYDVGNQDKTDVAFVFVASVKDQLEVVAETIAHEAGHSFGLDHTDNRKDLMFASNSSLIEGFMTGNASKGIQDGPAVLQANLGGGTATVVDDPSSTTPDPVTPPVPGGNGPIPNIPGLDIIAQLGELLGQISPDLSSVLTNLLPEIQKILPGNIPLNNPTDLAGLLAILQNAAGGGAGGLDIQKILDMLTQGGGGLPGGLPDISQILGLLTNPSGSIIPIILDQLLKGGSGGLPDLSQLLKLDSVDNAADLAKMVPQYGTYINQVSSGKSAKALQDLVKIAVSQRLAELKKTK